MKTKWAAGWGAVLLSMACLPAESADLITLKKGEEFSGAEGLICVKDGEVVFAGSSGAPRKFRLSDVASMRLEGVRELELKSGDILHVKGTSFREGTFHFASELLGEHAVPGGAVTRISEPALAAQREQAAGTSVQGGKGPEERGTVAERQKPAGAPGEKAKETPRKVSTAEKKPAESPKKWRGKIQFGYALASGRKDTQNVNLGADAVREGKRTRLTLRGGARYGETNGAETVNAQEGYGKIDVFLLERAYSYLDTGLLRDRVNLIDLRTSGGVGLGCKLVADERISLDGEAGISTIWERYTPEAESNGEQTEWHGRIAGRFVWNLGKGARFSEELELFPGLTSEDEFRMRSRSQFTTSITKKLSLATGFTIDYDGDPPAGVPRTSTNGTTGLMYTF